MKIFQAIFSLATYRPETGFHTADLMWFLSRFFSNMAVSSKHFRAVIGIFHVPGKWTRKYLVLSSSRLLLLMISGGGESCNYLISHFSGGKMEL